MPTLVATSGSATANSFATIAECDTFCDARLNASAWTDETDDDQKARALIGATAELSARDWWDGKRATSTQALAWPRYFAKNPDDTWGLYFDSSIVPQRVKNATMELAFLLLESGTTDLSVLDPTIAVIEKTVGPLTTRYAEPYARAKGMSRFPSVMRYLGPLVSSGGYTMPLVRG